MISKNRFKQYKHQNKKSEVLRQYRLEVNIHLRKQKKDDFVNKRRNVGHLDGDENPLDDQVNVRPSLDLSLSEIHNGLQSLNVDERFEAVERVRKALSKEFDPPIDDFIQTGLLPHFVQLLFDDHCPAIQYEAAWALTNVASGTSEQTQILVESSSLLGFKSLLSSPHQNIAEQSVWAVANIVGDSAMLRNAAIDIGIVEPLIALIHPSSSVSLTKNIAWTISNLCRHKEDPLATDVVEVILPHVCRFLFHKNEGIVSDACWALSYLTDGENDILQKVINAHVVPRLVDLLLSPNLITLIPTLRAIGNLVTGNDLQTQYVIDSGALPALKNLLSHKRRSVVKEATWAISNIAAGPAPQIQALLDMEIIEPIIAGFENFDEYTQKEAAWLFRNVCSGGTPAQTHDLIQLGVIQPICRVLKQKDTNVILIVLEILRHLLGVANDFGEISKIRHKIEEVGAFDDMELLQSHENYEIYRVAADIIDSFFYYDENKENIDPQESIDNFEFTFSLPCSEFTF